MRTWTWTAASNGVQRNLLALTMLTAVGTGAAGAEPVPPTYADDFPDLPALDAEELRTLRGGFEIAGLKFDFAAELRTFVDGRLALETLITYTKSGAITEHRPMPAPVDATQPATSPSAPAPPSPASAPVTAPVADGSVQVLGPDQTQTPAQLDLPGIDLSGIKDATGILIEDRKGTILALHEATRERITSMVINQATGRDIRQQLNVNVTVENFQQFRDSLRSNILNGRLNASQR